VATYFVRLVVGRLLVCSTRLNSPSPSQRRANRWRISSRRYRVSVTRGICDDCFRQIHPMPSICSPSPPSTSTPKMPWPMRSSSSHPPRVSSIVQLPILHAEMPHRSSQRLKSSLPCCKKTTPLPVEQTMTEESTKESPDLKTYSLHRRRKPILSQILPQPGSSGDEENDLNSIKRSHAKHCSPLV
jgi:hypothetical protein